MEEIGSTDCVVELKDGQRAIIRKMDDYIINIIRGSQNADRSRFEVTIFERQNGKYVEIEKNKQIFASQIERILSSY